MSPTSVRRDSAATRGGGRSGIRCATTVAARRCPGPRSSRARARAPRAAGRRRRRRGSGRGCAFRSSATARTRLAGGRRAAALPAAIAPQPSAATRARANASTSAGAQREPVVRHRARDRRRALDGVEAVHPPRRLAGACRRAENSRTSRSVAGAAGEEVGVERDDDVRAFERSVDGVDAARRTPPRAPARAFVAVGRLPLVPARLREAPRAARASWRGERRRGRPSRSGCAAPPRPRCASPSPTALRIAREKRRPRRGSPRGTCTVLRAVRVVEPERRGLGERVGRAEARRVERVSLGLRRPALWLSTRRPVPHPPSGIAVAKKSGFPGRSPPAAARTGRSSPPAGACTPSAPPARATPLMNLKQLPAVDPRSRELAAISPPQHLARTRRRRRAPRGCASARARSRMRGQRLAVALRSRRCAGHKSQVSFIGGTSSSSSSTARLLIRYFATSAVPSAACPVRPAAPSPS